MKSQYTKFVKHLEKSEKVYFQRLGDAVYLTETVIAVKVPFAVYSELIRPLSGIFPEAAAETIH